jgi:hypothetical protein
MSFLFYFSRVNFLKKFILTNIKIIFFIFIFYI